MAPAASRGAEPATAADALFREGRSAMEREDWARAVQVLAESQRLEPAPGTLLNLAIAEQKLGSLSAAWEHSRTVIDQLPPSDDRRRIARELFTSLDRRLPRLTLRSLSPLPKTARVRLDDVELGPATLGVPLPVDPGPHKIVLVIPGRAPRVLTATLRESEEAEKLLEPGEPMAAGPAPDDKSAPASSFPWTTTGWLTVGVGAACLVASGVTGYLAIDRNATVEDHCQGPYCDSAGAQAASEGKTFATASTATAISGLALAATGTLMLLFGPTKPPNAPTSSALAPVGFRF
jgi:hypothetical protein